MPPEMIDYLTLLQVDVQEFLNSYEALKRRFQEAADRGYPALLPGLEYPLPGALDHIDDGELVLAFAAFGDVKDALELNGRINYVNLVAVVRTWTF